jgi:sugar phosphate isomerase/epimerase
MKHALSVNHYICGPDIAFPAFAAAAEKAGLSAVGLSRAALAEMGAGPLGRCLADHGLAVSSLNSVGYFTDPDQKRIEAENFALIDAAAELDAEVLCVICGGLGDRQMTPAEGRRRVRQGFGPLAERAADAGVTLGVEPIHPMDILTKGCVNAVAGALDLIDGHEAAKLILDFYHSWWDPDLVRLAESAADRIALVQICNVRIRDGVPVGRDTLAGGALDIAPLLRAVTGGPYRGRLELELFGNDLAGRDALVLVRDFPTQMAAVSG